MLGMAKFQLVCLSAFLIVVSRSEKDALQIFVDCSIQMAGLFGIISLDHCGYIERPSLPRAPQKWLVMSDEVPANDVKLRY